MSNNLPGGDVQAERELIVQTALDYFEGWFSGDARRIDRAMHPKLAKRALSDDGATLKETTAAPMVAATAAGEGTRRGYPGRIEVDVVDVHGEIATAVVRSDVYREYLHLVRSPNGWRIVNALWSWA